MIQDDTLFYLKGRAVVELRQTFSSSFSASFSLSPRRRICQNVCSNFFWTNGKTKNH